MFEGSFPEGRGCAGAFEGLFPEGGAVCLGWVFRGNSPGRVRGRPPGAGSRGISGTWEGMARGRFPWCRAGLRASGSDSSRGYGASCEEFQAHFGDFLIRGIQGQNGRGLEGLQIFFSGKPFAASSGYIEHYGFILSDYTAAEGFEQ